MIVNQQNLHGLNVAYSTAYNKAFQGRKTQYERIATVVPSTTASTDYKWLGQMPQMRELGTTRPMSRPRGKAAYR